MVSPRADDPLLPDASPTVPTADDPSAGPDGAPVLAGDRDSGASGPPIERLEPVEPLDTAEPGAVPLAPDSDSAEPLPLPAVAALERDGMAWPPAYWERPASAWRDDVWSGPGPFQPYDLPEPTPEPATAPAGRGTGRLVREIVETGLLTLLIFLGIKLVVQNFKIQGASMEPTLHDGQFLLVNKLLYHSVGDPERGDIVVFKAWEQGGGEERDFIKRVIGVPQDTLEIRDGNVYVNNQMLDEPYLESANLTTDRIGPIVLGADDFYVMGDNRANSSDSRTYGPLSRERIIGKAWLSYWPLSDLGPIPDSVSSYASGPDG